MNEVSQQEIRERFAKGEMKDITDALRGVIDIGEQTIDKTWFQVELIRAYKICLKKIEIYVKAETGSLEDACQKFSNDWIRSPAFRYIVVAQVINSRKWHELIELFDEYGKV